MPADLSAYTTLRVGGPARELLVATSADHLVETMNEVWASGEPWLLLGGGSNVLIGDEGFDGTVVRVQSEGIEVRDGAAPGIVRVRVQAGHSWDALVAHAVAQGWAGIEGLSGIPGSTGAAPIQNIGAYGQELKESLVSIEFLDYLSGELMTLTAAELELDYRTSVLKQGRLGAVITVDLELAQTDGLSQPIAYDQLAGALGVAVGTRVPLADVRSTVLALRASKGMVLSPTDPDSVSAGSFFTNPIVGENFARTLPEAAPRWLMEPEPADRVVPLGEDPAPPAERSDFRVKLSAAWLIERAGIGKGFSLPGSRAAISSKHTLALTNRGGATAEEIASLARYVQTRVMSEFGVRLHPEPVFVGVEL